MRGITLQFFFQQSFCFLCVGWRQGRIDDIMQRIKPPDLCAYIFCACESVLVSFTLVQSDCVVRYTVN